MPRKQKAKRQYGVGRIFQRGQRWYVQFKGKKYATGSMDRPIAEDLLAELLRKQSRGELGKATCDYNVGDLLDDYLRRRSKLASGTKATYEGQVKNHLVPFLGYLPVNKVTTDLLTDYREFREKQPVHQGRNRKTASIRVPRKVSDTAINRELTLLRAAMNDLHGRRPSVLPSLPKFPMESEKDNVRQGFIREVDFVGKLLPELPRHLKCLTVCAFYCGARCGEWLKLNWDSVDFPQMRIRFSGNVTKNKKARVVPILPGLMETLLRSEWALHCDSHPDIAAVFTYQGQRLKSIGKSWDKACSRAGYPDLYFHDLRRSASKWQKDQGLGPKLRKMINGHLTSSMDDRYQIEDDLDLETAFSLMAKPRKTA